LKDPLSVHCPTLRRRILSFTRQPSRLCRPVRQFGPRN
jgi:hypothetical protein